jgi:protein-S-isoprenylcysteine O-methyltransferase Ste14
MFKLTLFFILSIGAAIVSRTSLLNPRSHGFYRFFAFECILALTLLNIDIWFYDPFSPFQLVSWLLLLSSLILALHSFYILRKYGNPQSGIDQTTVFVRRGIYRSIRHPLYTSLILFSGGILFKDPSIVSGVLILCISLFLFLTAKMEEVLNTTKFGFDYAEYMKSTKMMIPFIL